MSSAPSKLLVLNSPQYDESVFEAVGTVFITRVESISLVRGLFGSIGAIFGGKNRLIQEAMDRLKTRAYEDFIQKARSNPDVERVVGFNVTVGEVGSTSMSVQGNSEQMTSMVMTMIGTSLVRKKGITASMAATVEDPQPTQEGGRRRRNQTRRVPRPLRKRRV